MCYTITIDKISPTMLAHTIVKTLILPDYLSVFPGSLLTMLFLSRPRHFQNSPERYGRTPYGSQNPFLQKGLQLFHNEGHDLSRFMRNEHVRLLIVGCRTYIDNDELRTR